MRYPKIQPENIVETIHGVEVADPYRLMEDEKNPEVLGWVDEENALTDEWFKDSQSLYISEKIIEDRDIFSRSVPSRRGNMYVWYERAPGQKYTVLYIGSDFRGSDKRIILDPNVLSSDGSLSLSFFSISKLGNFAVWGFQESGDERVRVYIRDMQSGEDEEFYYGRKFSMDWRDDESGFYYVRSNFEDYGGDSSDETHYQQAYYHALGASRNEDTLLFNAMDYGLKESGLIVKSFYDDFVIVEMEVRRAERRTFLSDGKGDFQEVLPEVKVIKSLRIIGDYIYVTTDFEANYWQVRRVLISDVAKPFKEWQSFIAEDDQRKLAHWFVTKDRVVVEYTRVISSEVVILDREGTFIKQLELPILASIGGMWGNEDFAEFFFSLVTFLSPSIQYRSDQDGRIEEYWRYPDSLDETIFEAQQIWYRSTDNTQVPMTIVSKRDIRHTGDTPVIMYGYGGFAHGRYPSYMGMYKTWLNAGGLLALPNIRGGDEFGEAWHKSGKLANKQQSFDDFIVAAEYLISGKITCPEKLAIMGGSNGGLLVGACMMQRPELFGAVVSEVPLLDMIRFPRFLLAYRWIYEYGDPEKADEFGWLLKYSPYHNVDKTKQYPPVLLINGLNDSRIHPMHAWKMAALMQSADKGLVLLRSRGKAGHGSGQTFYKAMEDFAEKLAFISKVLGVDMKGLSGGI